MPRTILTDAPVRKPDRKTHTRIKDIRPPAVSVVLFGDAHKDAGRGLYLKVENNGRKTWALADYLTGKRRLTKLGDWPRMGPAAARIAAGNERDAIRKGAGSIDTKQSEQVAQAAAQAEQAAKADLTLGNLLEAYTDQLKRKGKASGRAVKNCLRRNVEQAFTKLWAKPAADITLDDCVEIVATLADADKLREAAKLRSYLRAAYTAAIKAHGDATAGELRKFKVTSNPAAMLATIEGNIQARQRVLSLLELRLYWGRISALPDPDGAVLRFHLLTGGQRLEQLFRVQANDRDGDDITLLDPKGRRKEPRVHVVPLLPEAQAALEQIGRGQYLVSFNGGETPATDARFRGRVRDVSAAMLEAGEIAEPFTPGDLRRTVETRLAAARIPSDHLKHLLSHGFGGVQDRHYQRYDFHAEKLAALKTLRGLLTQPSGDVLPMKRRAKK